MVVTGVDHTCCRDPVEVEGCGGGESTTNQWSQSEYVETVGVNGVLGGEFTVGAATQKKPGGDSTVGAGTQENTVVLASGDSITGLGPLVNLNTSGGGEMQGGVVMGVMGGRLRGVLDINYCCGIFTDYISARAHYSRLRSTLVPSVACQTTEGKYLLLTISSTY